MTADPPGYVLHERIGDGAHASVWRAEPQGRPGRVVAVKRLAGPVAPDAVRDLRREAEALERLSHPSILRLLDVVEDGDGLALVVPYAPGGTLAARIAAEGCLSAAEVADLGARLATALAAAHNAGLVHGDVKPANVLFDAEGQPLLADFGTARLHGEARAEVRGTAEYLDPEALTGPPAPTHDVYGLGATLYEALAGVPPYAGSTPQATLRASSRGQHVPLPTLVDAPAELTQAVEAALARGPAARPATASQLAGRLDEAARALHDAAAPPPPPPHAPAPTGRAGGAPAGDDEPLTPGDPAARAAGDGPQAATARPGAGEGPGERSGTQLFGPAPPRRDTAASPRRRRLDSRLLVAAAALVLVVPLALVWWLIRGDGEPADSVVPPIGDETPDAEQRDEAEQREDAERTPPPRCDDVDPPPDADDAQIHEADVEGRDCSVPVAWDGEQLVIPRPGQVPTRYDLDAREDDELLFGDWTCDGRDTPALYRPSTGEVFVFEGFASRGEEVTGRVEDSGVIDGRPRAVTDSAGCDRLEVTPD